MTIKTSVGIAGRFKIEAVNSKTGVRRLLAPMQPNVIVDAGLDMIATTGNWGRYCHVGTGNSTPTTSQTTLDTEVARVGVSSTSYTRASSSPWWVDVEQEFTFGEGVAAGNLAEIGLGPNSTSIFSRALIKDSGGTPTTITVLSDEFLTVTYILRFNFKSGDTAWSFSIGGSSYSGVVRAADADSFTPNTGSFANAINSSLCVIYSGAIGTEDATPSGTTYNVSSFTFDSYTPGSYKRTGTLEWSIANANNDLQALSWGDRLGRYQASITPALTKTSDDVLTFDIETSWARA